MCKRDLEEVFVAQYVLQRKSYDQGDVRKLEGEARAEFIRWNVLGLTDELHEALGEVGWKPWATSRHLNREAYKGELVDAFHFFINLCLAGDVTADELMEGYFEKRGRNAKRQSDGYTGLDKCPGCKRAWDDIDVLHANLPESIRFLSPSNQTFCSKACWEVALAEGTRKQQTMTNVVVNGKSHLHIDNECCNGACEEV